MTPSSPSLNGSTPAILTVLVGARRLPERRRRRVVFPDPLATSLASDSGYSVTQLEYVGSWVMIA